MKTQKMRWVALVLAMGLSGVAQAATYTNLPAVAGTPFGITLDTGSTAWESPAQSLGSTDTGLVAGSSSYTSAPVFNPTPTIINAQPGVPGSITFYTQTSTTTTNYLSQNQSFGINYSSSLTGPLSVPQTYLMSGQVQNLIGSNLLSGGNGYVNFDMGMNLQFVEPYVANSGNAKLSFKFGSAPGQWTYAFEETFALNPGSISLNNGNAINLSGITYFEASYSINGNPGVSFGIIPGLSLSMSGGMSSYQVTSSNTVLDTPVPILPSTVIPALPVPEAQTYAMLLAGLGLVGWAARRRATVK